LRGVDRQEPTAIENEESERNEAESGESAVRGTCQC
jgi:hypothetical protein